MIKKVTITGKTIPLNNPTICYIAYTTLDNPSIEEETIIPIEHSIGLKVNNTAEFIFPDPIEEEES